MGKILSTIAFCVLALCAGRGECEVKKAGASYGDDSFVLTFTKDPDGAFLVFSRSAEKSDFSIKTFDPSTLRIDTVGSFFLGLNERGFFNAITLFSGEKVVLGGDVSLRLNPNTAIYIRRTPQPLLLILSKDSIVAFLGKTLIFNEEWPELVKATRDALASGGGAPYDVDEKGALVFNGKKVGSRIGVEEPPTHCEAPDAVYEVKGEKDGGTPGFNDSPPIALAPRIFYNLESREAFSVQEPKGADSKCVLTPIPRP